MVTRFLYVPNLIGYGRAALMFIAYHYCESKPLVFYWCYFFSQFLDMFDGFAARKLHQATNFGAMLDMVCDRCSTIGLLLSFSHRYPSTTFWCHVFIWIDICSHWCHMLASLKSGSTSHKLCNSGPKLLQFYYKTNWFMVLLILGAEGFPCNAYMLSFDDPSVAKYHPIFKFLAMISIPLFITKHIINVLQFIHGSILLDPESENKEKAQ